MIILLIQPKTVKKSGNLNESLDNTISIHQSRGSIAGLEVPSVAL